MPDIYGFETLIPFEEVSVAMTAPEGVKGYMYQHKVTDAQLIAYPIVPEHSILVVSQEDIVSGLRQALTDRQGIIDVQKGERQDGREYAFTLIKDVQPETGVHTYVLTLDIAEKDKPIRIQGWFQEVEEIGLRESFVKKLYDEVLNLDVPWEKDPFDETVMTGELMNLSDEPDFDAHFPTSPLTYARQLIADLTR